MFSFFSEMVEKSGIPMDTILNGFRVVNLSNKMVYIEGFLKIVSFEGEFVNLKMKKGMLKVVGENLKIKNLNTNTVLICGNVFSVESYWC